ncbi:MAG: STAS domain-containing protein [Silicimonas sp.]|nr:STAS domain-containing protein [Silicimonas sp.]
MATRIVLKEKLDSASVEELREALLAAKDDDIALDGSAVEQLGGLSLELLMAARHLWGQAGKSLTLDTPSVQLIEDLGRFGLSEADFQGSPA